MPSRMRANVCQPQADAHQVALPAEKKTNPPGIEIPKLNSNGG